MARRLDEIMKSCTTVKWNDSRSGRVDFDREKFAQLLVHESADWINLNVGMITPEARADLLKHFGVES
jgi:hypothetical protein